MKLTAIALLLAGCATMLPSEVFAAKLTVDCNGGADFETIQEAVDAAAWKDTILVAPCVYDERVEVVDKVLYLRGGGAEVTEIRWAGEYEPLSIESAPAAGEFLGEVSGFTIVREAAGMPALYWMGGSLHIYDCVIEGDAIGATGFTLPPAAATIVDSDLESFHIGGSGRYSHVTNSVIGTMSLSGYHLYSGAYHHHWVWSEGCEYGMVYLGLTAGYFDGDVVGLLDMGQLASCNAVNTWFGGVESECSSLHLSECEVDGEVSVWGGTDLNQYDCGIVDAEGCLFGGDVEVYVDLYYYVPGTASAEVSHCTFLGDLMLRYAGGGEGFVYPLEVRGNIVAGATHIIGNAILDDFTVISHNDFVGSAALPPYCDSIFANISTDPLFCGATDYTLQECSPCAGTAHDGGDMGAFGVECACSTLVEEISWGRIKSLFR